MLVEKYRAGDTSSYNQLAERYFAMRFFLAKFFFSDSRHYLDEWDINGAFFHAFQKVVKNYDPGHNTAVLTYFRKVYENEIIRTYREKIRSTPPGLISLDEEFQGDNDSDTYTLSEMVASNSPLDDPAGFIRYADVLRLTNRLPKNVPPVALQLVQLKERGHSLRAAAINLNIDYNLARRAVRLYRNFALRTLKTVYGYDDKKRREKAAEFDQFLEDDPGEES